jgi:hypothetical protein
MRGDFSYLRQVLHFSVFRAKISVFKAKITLFKPKNSPYFTPANSRKYSILRETGVFTPAKNQQNQHRLQPR